MAKDKEKKLKNKNKKLKKKLKSALRHIATLEGKDPDKFVENFENNSPNESDSFDKLILAVGGDHKKIESTIKLNADNTIDKNDGSKQKTKTSAEKLLREAYAPDEKSNIEYKGDSLEERAENRKKHIRNLIEKYCDEHDINSEAPRERLFDYIMSNGKSSAGIVQLLREYVGELTPENLDPPDILNTDRQLTSTESAAICMRYREKADKWREAYYTLKDMLEEEV